MLAAARPQTFVHLARPALVPQGVTNVARKPLTAADGAARVLHPLMAWAGGRLPDDVLLGVLIWRDFLPLRLTPAAKEALWALRMHPLAAGTRSGRSEAAAVGSGGDAGTEGGPEVVLALAGYKVSTALFAAECQPHSATRAAGVLAQRPAGASWT